MADTSMHDTMWDDSMEIDNDREMDGRAEGEEDADMDEDALSEADSDYLELQADIARLDASRQAFLSEHLGAEYDARNNDGDNDDEDEDDDGGRRSGLRNNGGNGGNGTKRGGRRGPRKAAELSGEVQLQLSDAHQLFMDGRYTEALTALHEIIRVNAETHAAWTLLASIQEDMGRRDEALMAKVFAAHLAPKHVSGWLAAADYALAVDGDEETMMMPTLDETGEEKTAEERAEEYAARRLQNLQIARLCYSGAIRADKTNVAARLGKANVCLEFGQATNAATEYMRVLKRRPYDLPVVRNLAEASYDSVRGAETIEAAIAAYRRAIAHFRRMRPRTIKETTHGGLPIDPSLLASEESSSRPLAPPDDPDDDGFSWMDVTIYAELFAALSRYAEAIAALKSLARWLLGRGNERCWDQSLEGHDVDADADADAEWDRDDTRRQHVPGFVAGVYPTESYGLGLPADLRIKLAIYRLRLGQEDEALDHLAWLPPRAPATVEAMRLFPHLLKDVGAELYAVRRAQLALEYLETYRDVEMDEEQGGSGNEDADALVLQGKCHLELHDQTAAEECLLKAIEADDENIDARIELAKLYEGAHAKEQAFLLVNEALSLEAAQRQGEQQAHHQQHEDPMGMQDHQPSAKARPKKRQAVETAAFRVLLDDDGNVLRRQRKDKDRRRKPRVGKGAGDGGGGGGGGGGGRAGGGGGRRLYGHARRLFASPADQIQFEADTTSRLRARYTVCQEAKARAAAAAKAGDVEGEQAATAEWMGAAKELIDDFRSFRDFYPWDKYVAYLGYHHLLHDGEGEKEKGLRREENKENEGNRETTIKDSSKQRQDLTELAERLQQSARDEAAATGEDMSPSGPVASAGAGAGASAVTASATKSSAFRGIPFDDWLALFLEYALSLAHAGQPQAAYAVCQAALDSTVYRQQHDSAFRIHLTWAACAVRVGDAAACISVARYFMRARPGTSDCYRLFAVLCRLCRGGGGGGGGGGDGDEDDAGEEDHDADTWFTSSPAQKFVLRQIRHRDSLAQPRNAVDELDVCLLIVYGHILFASTSFQFALNYYQRARAVDPTNPLIHLFIGLAYVHWALKRQAANRQYLILQGLNYVFRYADHRLASAADNDDIATRREVYYNVARTYHLLGLHALAAEWYEKVLSAAGGNKHARAPEDEDGLCIETAYNLRTYYLVAGRPDAAMRITKQYLVM